MSLIVEDVPGTASQSSDLHLSDVRGAVPISRGRSDLSRSDLAGAQPVNAATPSAPKSDLSLKDLAGATPLAPPPAAPPARSDLTLRNLAGASPTANAPGNAVRADEFAVAPDIRPTVSNASPAPQPVAESTPPATPQAPRSASDQVLNDLPYSPDSQPTGSQQLAVASRALDAAGAPTTVQQIQQDQQFQRADSPSGRNDGNAASAAHTRLRFTLRRSKDAGGHPEPHRPVARPERAMLQQAQDLPRTRINRRAWRQPTPFSDRLRILSCPRCEPVWNPPLALSRLRQLPRLSIRISRRRPGMHWNTSSRAPAGSRL